MRVVVGNRVRVRECVIAAVEPRDRDADGACERDSPSTEGDSVHDCGEAVDVSVAVKVAVIDAVKVADAVAVIETVMVIVDVGENDLRESVLGKRMRVQSHCVGIYPRVCKLMGRQMTQIRP